jgi:hypothetical protein
MKWRATAVRRLVGLVLAGCVASSAVNAAPRRDIAALEASLREHIAVLASDEYGGRRPGTEGEALTLRYLGREFFEAGLSSGTNDPGNPWFAPVTVIGREPAGSTAQFMRRGKPLTLPASEILVLTSGKRSLVRAAPVLFVGKGDSSGLDRTELAGRIAMMLDDGSDTGERQTALLAAGAAAVLTVLDGDRSLAGVAARRQRTGYALASDAPGGDLEAYITRAGLERLLAGDPLTLAELERQAASPDFAPRTLNLAANLEATSNETEIRTHNVIGKLPGRRPGSGAVLFVAHWDHFGQCAEPPAEHLICNGAIDNASGVAALIELARRLANGPRLDRDVYFLSTTAEEMGLLGARAFAANPPLPLGQIVAAFNLDSIALAPAGTPLGVVGLGMTPLDPMIAQVARRERRRISNSSAGNDYVRRQDGWALLKYDIPAVMVTSAYGDVRRVERFFDGDYHRPTDRFGPAIELGGAAEDVEFHVALARWFADTRRVPIATRR